MIAGMTAQPAPSQHLALPLGYRGLRAAVLAELKRAGRLTTKELAGRTKASLNAVRHHLRELEEQNLVEYERQSRGVGAPAFAYRLTQSGESLFPTRYEATLSSLLDHLVEHEGRAATVTILESRYTGMAERLRKELANVAPDERLARLARLLSEEGYMAEVNSSGNMATLTEHNCAIRSVAERFPEICAAEARFLGAVLGGIVQREKHILSGCSACEYRVSFEEQPAPLKGDNP